MNPGSINLGAVIVYVVICGLIILYVELKK